MKLAITLPAGVQVVTGKQVSFIAPCCSLDIEGLVVNGVEYAVVDADGVNVAGSLDVWDSGAMVSVILDTSTMKAYVQNPAISPIRDRIMHIEAMVTNNDFFVPIATDDATPFAITDDDGNVIGANWGFQEKGDLTKRLEQVILNLEHYIDFRIFSIAPYKGAGAHNAIYRGKYLGHEVTSAQYAAIQKGTFDDLYIGDYWTINGVNWRIAAFDYYLNCGDTNCTTHHAVIVPDTCLYTHVMNDTNVTTGGYTGSKMYTQGLEQAKTIIKAAFPDHVLKHRVLLTNAVSNGKPSGGAWCDSEVELMTEEMVYGCGIFRPTSDGSTVPYNYRVEKSQLPLFAHEPSRICNRTWYWLRDVVSATAFAIVSSDGLASHGGASNAGGVRPAFSIS